ncbi:MAG: tetratricopeptide repeat protein [Phycisphaerae bacterium]|nr:tetratricopeptide repeat protein [Saprospiraceae bacterium]
MNERDTILLNNYFNGLLPPEEARDVEARAASDPVFMEEFALRKEMEAFPRKEAEREAFIATLKTVGAEYLEEKVAEIPRIMVVRNNMRRWIALAASVTLIATAIWFFTRSGDMTTYQQYAHHEPLSFTVMGDNLVSKTDAETAFEQKNFDRALAALDQVLVAEPDNVKAKFYRGICLLELGRAAEARAIFEPLAAGNSALREDAAWYVALSFLREKNTEACKAALLKIDSGSVHYKAAQEILKGL